MALQAPWVGGVQVAVIDQDGELGGTGGTPLNPTAVQEIAVTLGQLPAAAVEAEGATDGYVPVANGADGYTWEAPAAASVPASTVLASAATAAAQVPVADGTGGYTWEAPAVQTPAASYVDAEAATSGYVPVANGDNGYTWEEPSSSVGAGATLAEPTLGNSVTDVVTLQGFELETSTLTRTYAYNASNQLETVTYSDGATTVATITYAYSSTASDATLSTKTVVCGTTTVTTTYTYTSGQLTSATTAVTT